MELIGGNGGDYPRRRGEERGRAYLSQTLPPQKKVCELVCGLVENLVLSRFSTSLI